MVTKAKTLEAKTQLKHVHRLEKSYFYEHSRYSSELEEIGFEQEILASEEESGKANCQIEIVSATPSTFIAKATAVVDFDGDGEFNLWEIDEDKKSN